MNFRNQKNPWFLKKLGYEITFAEMPELGKSLIFTTKPVFDNEVVYGLPLSVKLAEFFFGIFP